MDLVKQSLATLIAAISLGSCVADQAVATQDQMTADALVAPLDQQITEPMMCFTSSPLWERNIFLATAF